jgi:hypothetical protein
MFNIITILKYCTELFYGGMGWEGGMVLELWSIFWALVRNFPYFVCFIDIPTIREEFSSKFYTVTFNR